MQSVQSGSVCLPDGDQPDKIHHVDTVGQDLSSYRVDGLEEDAVDVGRHLKYQSLIDLLTFLCRCCVGD
jgi:hypothetical protein